MRSLRYSAVVALSLVCTLTLAGVARAQTGVQCDGSNDYITFGSAPALGATAFTLELWFYKTGLSSVTSTGSGGVSAVPLLTKGRSENDGSNVDMNYFLGFRGTDNVLCADYEEGDGQASPGLNHPVFGVTSIRNNTWYHAAATFDGTTWTLYLNGKLEATLAVGAGRLPQSLSIQHAALATALNSTGVASGFFNGIVDEARIWNYARTQQQINDSMYSEITSDAGLLGRWGMNEADGITANNSVVTGPSGTLTNGPTWSTGSTFAFSNSLKMGASNSGYVAFGDPNALDLAQFTVETWFRRDGSGSVVGTGTGGVDAIPLVTHGGPENDGGNLDMNYFLGIRASDNVLCADLEEGASGAHQGQNHPVAGVTPILIGTWYHAAATYDGNTWKLYLNGSLEATLAVNQPVQNASIEHAGLAASFLSDGSTVGHFDGALDEARVWNYARTVNQIRLTMNSKINVPTTGLVGRWGLDDGAGSTVLGGAGTNINGVITGTQWSWDTPAPFNAVPSSPPSAPVLNSPLNLATNVSLAPTLDVTVSDPDADSVTVSFYGRTKSTVDPTPFTLVHLPDTQFYTSQQFGGTIAMLNSQMQWIVDKRNTRHIAWVDQTGDCTDHGDDIIDEWNKASASFGLIENPLTTGRTFGMPFSIDVGNHDETPLGDADGTTIFYNQFFGVSHFAGRSYYGGHHSTTNDNHFSLFTSNGMKFVVLSLKYDTTPNATVLDWADSVVTAFPDRWAIVSSHYLMDSGVQGNFSTLGQAVYDRLKDNPNYFLMICSHIAGEGRRVDTYQGRTVHTVMADYQARANGGNGWLRIMTFYPAENVIRVKTYSPVTDQYETDADSSSQFTLPVSLSTTPGWQLIGTQKVASGAHASVVWPARLVGTSYEWYVSLDDGHTQNVAGPVWSFTTGSAAPTVSLTSPNGGESFAAGSNLPIRWTATDDVNVTSVDILLSRTGPAGPFVTIKSGAGNTGIETWSVVGPGSNNAFIKVIAHDGSNNTAFDVSDAAFTIQTPTGVDGKVPAVFGLGILSENPFSYTGRFNVSLAHAAHVNVTVYDVAGRRVAQLVDDSMAAGQHVVQWNGDDGHSRAASGVYFVRMQAAGLSFTKRVVLLR
ncbi:MAG TPA: LamG-like jellyroll fold domain-containing protein [Candidatus Krumholzibacteria bacterium]|nr:LamG-like jellyroll fold domain-containing protein [Candidatus Krumholzibacteria bacterium]